MIKVDDGTRTDIAAALLDTLDAQGHNKLQVLRVALAQVQKLRDDIYKTESLDYSAKGRILDSLDAVISTIGSQIKALAREVTELAHSCLLDSIYE